VSLLVEPVGVGAGSVRGAGAGSVVRGAGARVGSVVRGAGARVGSVIRGVGTGAGRKRRL